MEICNKSDRKNISRGNPFARACARHPKRDIRVYIHFKERLSAEIASVPVERRADFLLSILLIGGSAGIMRLHNP